MTIDAEREVLGGGEGGFWAKEYNFSFIAVEFEEVVVHPGFYVGEAVGEGGENSCGDGFGGDVDLSVVSIAVKVKSMAADDVTKWKHVEDEEDGTKH